MKGLWEVGNGRQVGVRLALRMEKEVTWTLKSSFEYSSPLLDMVLLFMVSVTIVNRDPKILNDEFQK